MHLQKLIPATKKLTLTRSGDHAIGAVLKALKKKGVTTLLLQDQGGWLTYKRFAQRLKLNVIELSTKYGILDAATIPVVTDAALLINSLPGYIAQQPMEPVVKRCADLSILLVNDVSGSIGTPDALHGDILLGSFGNAKPVNLGYGGFIAAPEIYEFTETFDRERLPELEKELDRLRGRRAFLTHHVQKIKNDLSHLDIVHRDAPGLNVVIKYQTGAEKNEILAYCTENGYETTECPRSIRILDQAISIEVKRLTSSSY
jgi:hypothetical protein